MTILVTGAAGFLGSNVVRMLHQSGREVVGLGRHKPGERSVIAALLDELPFVAMDITDLDGLRRLCERYHVEGIIHTAAMISAECNRRPAEAMRVNVEGTVNVLEVARALKLRKVVCCSSSSVTGWHTDLSKPMKEWDIKMPLSGLYAVSKLADEGICGNYRTLFDVDAVAMRPSRAYGPGFPFLDHPLPLQIMFNQAVAGQPIIKACGGDSVFDYTYAKDTAQGMILAYDAPRSEHWLFNLSFGQLRSAAQVAEVLRGVFPQLPIELGPGLWEQDVAEGDSSAVRYHIPQKPPMDISLAREVLGYEPQYDIDKGIRAWLAWEKHHEYI